MTDTETGAAPPSAWNIANALTVARLFLVPVFGWLLLAGGGHDTAMRYWAAFVFFVAMLTDRIDGDIARSRGLVTDFGKVVDPIADKALMSMALIGLSYAGDVRLAGGHTFAGVPWWITILILVREWGVTALRFFVIRHGVLPASRGGKVKTLLQALGLWLFVLPLWTWPGAQGWHTIAWGVLLVAFVVTMVTGLDYVGRALRLRQNSPRAAMKRARRQQTP